MKVPSLALPTIAPSRFNYWHRFRTKISVPRKNVHATIITFYDPYIFFQQTKNSNQIHDFEEELHFEGINIFQFLHQLKFLRDHVRGEELQF